MSLPAIVTLADAKAYCRVDYDEEDTLFEAWIATATETALAHADGLPSNATDYPASIKTAVLLHVSRLYTTREDATLPEASATLARRYRKWDV